MIKKVWRGDYLQTKVGGSLISQCNLKIINCPTRMVLRTFLKAPDYKNK
jgi:hypothetical protein